MARYERDYGRDFTRRGQGGAPLGGMRSDGWGSDWRDFPGEEGWYGEGYEGPAGGFGHGRGTHWQGGGPEMDRGFQGAFGGSQYDRGEWGTWGGGRERHGRERYGAGARGYGAEYGIRSGFGGYDDEYGARGGYGARTAGTGYGGREIGYGEASRRGGWGSSRETGFGRSRASEIMTQNPECVTAETTITEVARKMRDLNVGIIPVVDSHENRRLRGLITDRDVTVRAVAEGKDGNARVNECMTDRVRSVNKNDSIQEVMRVMREEQVRRVPVTDREGRLVGIIAQADLAVDFAGHDPRREIELGETVERISEPARPQRTGERMAATGRTAQQGAEGRTPSEGTSSDQ